MPGSYHEALELIKPFLLPLERDDACVNHCILFRKENANASCCPICGQRRYDVTGNARRTFTYFPLGPQIARMLASSKSSKLRSKSKDDGWIRDIQDTVTWKSEWFSKDGLFGGQLSRFIHHMMSFQPITYRGKMLGFYGSFTLTWLITNDFQVKFFSFNHRKQWKFSVC